MTKLLAKFKRTALSPLFDRSSSSQALNVELPTPARVTSYNGLEKLPPEIRRQILSTLDLQSLNFLVHSSAIFHEQYLEDRRYLLCSSLETTLGIVTSDACAAFQSGSPDFSYTRENVMNLLGSLRVNKKPLHERLREHEAVEMAAFHLSIISPLLQYYTSWALANLATQSGNIPRSTTPSRVEERRLLRFFYRFQLCCNLFRKGGQKQCTKQNLGFRPVEILQLFSCLFEPWEVEEISCINTFAQDKYDQIFQEISWDVNKKNPKFDGQRPPTPEGAFDFENSWARKRLLTGTVSLGLELLHKEALGETAQWERRQEALSKRDEKQNRRDPLPFNGDEESCPPLAWTLIWGGTYSNLYGYYVQDTIRRFGYVFFFDAITIESLGAKDILLREWKKDWGDSDPRNDI
ncbi:hypothetical protein F4813DRAFT_393248 [Daldinia decipiens]|uniref:uncharacterized protein n=1 Tax=Daldinia decipiens TaxID=326647 RepID=UPI0020C245D8|nr:uncharacterized protein F4813DRAFT_393248 [Daldinia decipiens]KAI1653868.1 hypothetical protein F4813DRAFT_393248 [Daldinia decipiens]